MKFCKNALKVQSHSTRASQRGRTVSALWITCARTTRPRSKRALFLTIFRQTNRFLIAPDGIAFQNEGMLGQAWIDTPVGKKSPSDAGRRSWTLVLNTDNFKGQVAFMHPDYWAGSAIKPNTATPAFKYTSWSATDRWNLAFEPLFFFD